MSDAHIEELASYVHAVCQRNFSTQTALDNHIANLLADPVCRVNEALLLKQGLNCTQNCGP